MTVENTQAGTEQTEQQTTESTQNQQTSGKSTQIANTGEAGEQKDESTLLGGESKEESASKAPENYENFTVPEGMELDTGLVEKISPVLKEVGLSQENAQKLVDTYAPYVQQQMAAQQEATIKEWDARVETWKAETIKGLGVTSKEDLVVAGKFIDKFGSPQLREILNETGLGNHPEIVKIFIKAGKAISEDTFVESGQSSTESKEGIDLKKMYPTMQKE